VRITQKRRRLFFSSTFSFSFFFFFPLFVLMSKEEEKNNFKYDYVVLCSIFCSFCLSEKSFIDIKSGNVSIKGVSGIPNFFAKELMRLEFKLANHRFL